jgi:uncharacterized coiled-coil protein SlyX
MDNEHITHLEIALAHQDQQIQELSEIVNRQWREIEALNRRLDKALAQMADTGTEDGGKEDSAAGFAAANKPPHY